MNEISQQFPGTTGPSEPQSMGYLPRISSSTPNPAPVPQKPKSKLLLWAGVIGAVVIAAAVLIFVLQKPIIYEGGRGQLVPTDCSTIKNQEECQKTGGQCIWERLGVDTEPSACIKNPKAPPRKPPVESTPMAVQPLYPIVTDTSFPTAVPAPSTETTPSVSIALTPTPTCKLTANPTQVKLGGSTTLTMTTSGTITTATLDGSKVNVAGDTRILSPRQTQTFEGTVTGPTGTSKCWVTVTVTGTTEPSAVFKPLYPISPQPPLMADPLKPFVPGSLDGEPAPLLDPGAAIFPRFREPEPPMMAIAPPAPQLPFLGGPPPIPFDYKIRPIANATVKHLDKISVPITIEKLSGTAQAVTLSASTIAPAGSSLQYTFSHVSCTPNTTCNSTLTIQTAATTLMQIHRVRVIGRPLGRVAEFNLDVLAPPAPAAFDFKLSNSGNASITKGTNVVAAITVTRTSGTAKPVTLSVLDITPARPYYFMTTKGQNATCTPNPEVCIESLFIDTKTAEVGDYRVVVNGDPGAKTTQFIITITEPPAAAAEKLGCSITVTPDTVTKGQQVTLEIKVTGVGIVSTVLDDTPITLNNTKSGTKVVTPDASRSYIGTVKDSSGGVIDCSKPVTVNEPRPVAVPPPPPVQCADPKHVYDAVKKVCVPPSTTVETKCADPTYRFDPDKKICVPPSTTAETKCADPTYRFDPDKRICVPPSTVAETKCADPTYKFDLTRKVCVPPTEVIVTKTVTKSDDGPGPVEDPIKTKTVTVKEPTVKTIVPTTPRQPYGTFIQGKTGPGVLIYPAGIILANATYYLVSRRKKNRL